MTKSGVVIVVSGLSRMIPHNAPINVKPPGGEAGLGVEIRLFLDFVGQIPHHRDSELGQMQLKIPTWGQIQGSNVPRWGFRMVNIAS